MQLGKDFKKVLTQIEVDKGLSEEIIVSSLEAAMISAYKKFKGGNQTMEVYIDVETGEVTLYEVRMVVESIENPDSEITYEEATKRGYTDLEIGDVIRREVFPENFGRIAAQTARQVIIQRLKDAERQVVYEQFADKIGNVVTGTIFKAEGDQILVRLNEKSEAIMPKEERIIGEKYLPGDRMKFYLLDVRQTTRGPRIIVSRTHPGLLRRLLEIEVPEIYDGVVEIKSISREAGSRTKMAVYSSNPDVDAIGSCIGNKGARVNKIVEELGGEKIDIVLYSDDPEKYISAALSPASVCKVEITDEETKSCRATVPDGQLSLAIGNKGQNARLAARLTGWRIDIRPESGFYGEDEDDEPKTEEKSEDVLDLDESTEGETVVSDEITVQGVVTRDDSPENGTLYTIDLSVLAKDGTAYTLTAKQYRSDGEATP